MQFTFTWKLDAGVFCTRALLRINHECIDTDKAATSGQTAGLRAGRTGYFPSSHMPDDVLAIRDEPVAFSALLVHVYRGSISTLNLRVLAHDEMIHHKLHVNPFSFSILTEVFFFISHTLKKNPNINKKNPHQTNQTTTKTKLYPNPPLFIHF